MIKLCLIPFELQTGVALAHPTLALFQPYTDQTQGIGRLVGLEMGSHTHHAKWTTHHIHPQSRGLYPVKTQLMHKLLAIASPAQLLCC